MREGGRERERERERVRVSDETVDEGSMERPKIETSLLTCTCMIITNAGVFLFL